MKYIFFSISKVTEFGCLSILHLSVSLPLHTHRCNTWDAVRADGSGVPFSNPFHLYLYIELYSSVENQITLSTLQLSVSLFTPTYTEYEQCFWHRQFAGHFHVLYWRYECQDLQRSSEMYIFEWPSVRKKIKKTSLKESRQRTTSWMFISIFMVTRLIPQVHLQWHLQH